MTQQHDSPFIKKIQNPLVLILAISEYNKEKSNCNPLPNVKKDIDQLVRLFTLEFGYNKKYVLVCETLKEFAEEKGKEAQKAIFEHETQDPFDAFIFIYSGHGNENGMIGTNGRYLTFNTVYAAFSNMKFPFMKGVPRLYIQDCCRGRYYEIPSRLPKSSSYTNYHDDRFIWRSSSRQCISYVTQKGSVLISAICDVFRGKILNRTIHRYGLLSTLHGMVYSKVMNEQKGEQTPEIKTQAGYDVYFSTHKHSPYYPENQRTPVLRVQFDTNPKFLDKNPFQNKNNYQNSQNNSQKSKRCEDVLRIMKLDKYIQDFIDAGFQSTDSWKKLDDKILRDDIGMKLKHREAFFKMLKNLKMLKKL